MAILHSPPNFYIGGRRKPDPSKPRLAFADFLKATPAHPIADPPPGFTWPMDRNDEAGDCVVAGGDHALQCVYGLLGVPRNNWTDAQILAYYQTQNPGFRGWGDSGGPNDGGMLVQDFLAYLVKHGVILGFASVNHANEDELLAATYLGLAVVTGEVLTTKNLRERVWDHHAGDREAGGHCTVTVGYDSADRQVSWGDLYGMTPAFMAQNVDEAWFIITQAHVDHPSFRAGYDLAGFAAAYTALTGRPFPVPITPTPTPVPPTPDPGAASFPGATVAVDEHIVHSAARRGMTVTDFQNYHWQHYFNI